MIARWSMKSLMHRPATLAGSIAALASAMVLVVLFEGIWLGESEKTAAYPTHTDADVWVMQRGVSNMHMATSFIPESKRDRVEAVSGVDEVDAILYLSMLIRSGNWRAMSYVVGLPDGARRGGPWSMADGKPRPGPGEAVLPDLMAKMAGVGIGGQIHIADKTLEVVGLSRGTYSMVNPITFVYASDLSDLLSLKGYDSYFAVKAAPGVRPSDLARRIEAEVEDVAALPKEEFIRNDIDMSMQMGIELIGLITGIGQALAGLILAFVLYTHTWNRRRDLAVLKALGYRNRHLYAGVLMQSLALGVLGLAATLALAFAGAAAVSAWVPQVAVKLSVPAFAKVAAGAALVALAATLVPARQVAHVDPHSVFQ